MIRFIRNYCEMKRTEAKAKHIVNSTVVYLYENSEDFRSAVKNVMTLLNTTSPDELTTIISSLGPK